MDSRFCPMRLTQTVGRFPKDKNMPVIIPNCEYCNSPMKFFDEAWVEGELLIVASVICTNQDCLNSSVVYIHAQHRVQPTGGESAPLQALSTPEVDSIGGTDTTPPTIG